MSNLTKNVKFFRDLTKEDIIYFRKVFLDKSKKYN